MRRSVFLFLTILCSFAEHPRLLSGDEIAFFRSASADSALPKEEKAPLCPVGGASWPVPVLAQKLTVSQCHLPKLEFISCEPQKKVDRHPFFEFREQFAISWIMADYYKGFYSTLTEQDKKKFIEGVQAESKDYEKSHEIVWQEIKKQNPQLINWLLPNLSDSTLTAFVSVKMDVYSSPPPAVPPIDLWQCQIADLLCLEYFCLYKAKKGELKYDSSWFVFNSKPMPEKIIALLTKEKSTPFVQKQQD